MAGRKPKPTAVKALNGNPGGRPLNKSEPLAPGTPLMPLSLSEKAKETWARVVGHLQMSGALQLTDELALERLCEVYAELQSYRAILEKEQAVYATTSTSGDTILKAHPAVAMLSDADKRLRSLLAEFGMTPSSRSRINAESVKTYEDPLDEFVT